MVSDGIWNLTCFAKFVKQLGKFTWYVRICQCNPHIIVQDICLSTHDLVLAKLHTYEALIKNLKAVESYLSKLLTLRGLKPKGTIFGTLLLNTFLNELLFPIKETKIWNLAVENKICRANLRGTPEPSVGPGYRFSNGLRVIEWLLIHLLLRKTSKTKYSNLNLIRLKHLKKTNMSNPVKSLRSITTAQVAPDLLKAPAALSDIR